MQAHGGDVQAVEAVSMDGSLIAESAEGQGTTFTVELPESSHRPLSGTPSRP